MRTPVPERLLAVADEIGARGSANLTRLTVLKRWFEAPGRLGPFGLWVASRAASRSGKTQGAARELFREARQLLREAPTGSKDTAIPIEAAERFAGPPACVSIGVPVAALGACPSDLELAAAPR